METDILIIGGGFAGLSAAARAGELGLKALVLEQGSGDYLCNSRIAVGFIHICRDNPAAPADHLREKIHAVTDGFADPKLAALFANEGRRAVEWIRSSGITLMRIGQDPLRQALMGPPPLGQPGLHWKGRGPDAALRRLSALVADRGGRISLASRATDLVMADGRCRGANAVIQGKDTRIDASAVVIADGGFQANRDAVRRFISRSPGKLMQRNAGTGRGDGLHMAEAAGARLVGMESFYGHVMSRDAFTNALLWPFPYLDIMAVSGVVVDAAGRRFMDEGHGPVYMANAMARRDDPLDAFVIFDDQVWRGPATDMASPPAPNPALKSAGATIHEAPSLAALASVAGISADGLVATIAAYNDALATGSLGKLDPPRTHTRHKAFAITKPPFYAAPACPGISYTMGGPAIDENARVMHRDGHAIEGLFAAGAASGGLEGGAYSGYVGGLGKAILLGLRAAEYVARSRQA